MVAEEKLKPLCSTALFLEYETVLTRPDIVARHGLNSRNLTLFLAEFALLAQPVELHFRWRPQLADAGDELVLEAAVNGRANCLITHNLRDFRPAAQSFDLPVKTPQDYLREASS